MKNSSQPSSRNGDSDMVKETCGACICANSCQEEDCRISLLPKVKPLPPSRWTVDTMRGVKSLARQVGRHGTRFLVQLHVLDKGDWKPFRYELRPQAKAYSRETAIAFYKKMTQKPLVVAIPSPSAKAQPTPVKAKGKRKGPPPQLPPDFKHAPLELLQECKIEYLRKTYGEKFDELVDYMLEHVAKEFPYPQLDEEAAAKEIEKLIKLPFANAFIKGKGWRFDFQSQISFKDHQLCGALATCFHPAIWETERTDGMPPKAFFDNKEKFNKGYRKWLKYPSASKDKFIPKDILRYLKTASGVKACTNFPPTLARIFYALAFLQVKDGESSEWPKEKIRVLDPSAGFSGRLVGAMGCPYVEEYVGYDPSPAQIAGGLACEAKFRELAPAGYKPCAVKLIQEPFDEATLEPDSFDVVLTSPPYFDLEMYKGGTQSWEKYKTKEEWLQGFFLPYLRNIYKALKPGGSMFMNTGTMLQEDYKKLAKEVFGGSGYLMGFDSNKDARMQKAGQASLRVDPIFHVVKGESAEHPEFQKRISAFDFWENVGLVSEVTGLASHTFTDYFLSLHDQFAFSTPPEAVSCYPKELQSYVDAIFSSANCSSNLKFDFFAENIDEEIEAFGKEYPFGLPTRLFRMPKRLKATNDDEAVVAFTGGKDSLAVALKLKKAGKKVTGFFVKGVNSAYAQEHDVAMRLAKLIGIKFYDGAGFKTKTKQDSALIENPTKNQLILAMMVDYGLANGKIKHYALGNVSCDIALDKKYKICSPDYKLVEITHEEYLAEKEKPSGWKFHGRVAFAGEKYRCGLSDCIELFLEADDFFKAAVDGYERKTWLANDTDSFKTIIETDPRLLEAIGSCITSDRKRDEKRRHTLAKYEITLMPNRCGKCYKCASEYLHLWLLGKIKNPNSEYLKDCFNTLRCQGKQIRGEKYTKGETISEFFDEKLLGGIQPLLELTAKMKDASPKKETEAAPESEEPVS